jgi:hypothetical protein
MLSTEKNRKVVEAESIILQMITDFFPYSDQNVIQKNVDINCEDCTSRTLILLYINHA